MVGAASFCAAITHTISISVIVFELTGQITYVIPIMVRLFFLFLVYVKGESWSSVTKTVHLRFKKLAEGLQTSLFCCHACYFDWSVSCCPFAFLC